MSNFETSLSKVTNTYLPMITRTIENNDMQFTDYQKQCVVGAISEISNVIESKDKTFNDIDQRSLTEALTLTATLQLNPAAAPREIYFITRNKKVGNNWVTVIEPGIEGDGNDALLARFGRDLETVHKYWEVRESDAFSYPSFKGLELSPPEWKPTGKGRVIRIVYPITKTNGDTDFLIAERDDVVVNLKAHIRNNLMNETFGIAESRYKANPKQLKEIDGKKKELFNQLEGKSLDDLLKDETFEKYISPAWKDSSDQMIIRKMRNNVVKKYPKNFENALISRNYNEATDESVQRVRRTVNEEANQEVIDFDDIPIAKDLEPKLEDDQQNEIIDSDPPEETSKKDEIIEPVENKPEPVKESRKEPEQTSMFKNLNDLNEPGF